MKSALIVGALAAALSLVAPVAAQAATAKLTDHEIYCTFMPFAADCAKPAAPVVKPAVTPVKKVASVKKAGIPKHVLHTADEVPVCTKRTDGQPYLMSCVWKKG